MVLFAMPGRVRWAARIRLAILVAVALLVGHTAIYAAEDGVGVAYAAAMDGSGHRDWWLPASLVVIALAMALGFRAVAGLARLEIRVRAGRRSARPGNSSFPTEVASIARRLVPLVIVLFAIQENVEQLAASGRLLGIEAVVGPNHPMALPILVAVGLALSALGGLVRWRTAVLGRRIAERRDGRPRRLVRDRIGAAWRTVGALAPRRWMLVRLDAGRSPPVILRS